MDVACLDPGDEFDYAARFEDIVRDRTGQDIRFDAFSPHRDDLPSDTDYDAVLVAGSAAHVYDDDPWIDDTQRYLDQAMDDGVPVLGVCYGHQLVADARGGAVAALGDWDATPYREMGYRDIDLTAAGADHPLFTDVPDTFTSFTSHLDHVTALPGDATILAANDYGVQSFALDEAGAYGIQFHPEFNLYMAQELLAGKKMPDDERAQVADTLTLRNAMDAGTARQVLENFFTRIVADREDMH